MIIATESLQRFLREKFWVTYPAWIGMCALIFLAVQDLETPSDRPTRISNGRVADLAMSLLKENHGSRFEDYTVAHVAYARKGEVGETSRWVVLSDQEDRTALLHAIVVEIEVDSQSPIRFRRAHSGFGDVGILQSASIARISGPAPSAK